MQQLGRLPATDPEARARDKALLERLRAGEDAAFRELVEANTGPMLAVARRFMRNEDDARDAVQDAFLSGFRALERFAGDSLLSTWLHRITINACLMKLRTRRRRPEGSIDDLLPGFLEDGRLAGSDESWQDRADAILESRQSRGPRHPGRQATLREAPAGKQSTPQCRPSTRRGERHPRRAAEAPPPHRPRPRRGPGRPQPGRGARPPRWPPGTQPQPRRR